MNFKTDLELKRFVRGNKREHRNFYKDWLKHFSYSIHGRTSNRLSHTFLCNFGGKLHSQQGTITLAMLMQLP